MNEKVKLPRSSYEELCKIIKAYGQLNQPAPLDEISALSTIPRTGVSANNTFLSYAQIIEGGNKKSATSAGRSLSMALEHDLPGKISKAWREIVENNEFLNKMALAVKIRRGMETSALVAHIAYNAGEKKTKTVMTGARTVLDILTAADLIKEEDGKIVPVDKSSYQHEKGDATSEVTIDKLGKEKVLANKKIQYTTSSQQGISVNIDVRIQTTPSELEDLAAKLKTFLKQITEIEDQSDGHSNEEL